VYNQLKLDYILVVLRMKMITALIGVCGTRESQ